MVKVGQERLLAGQWTGQIKDLGCREDGTGSERR